MELFPAVLGVGLTLAGYVLLFRPLETAFAARPGQPLRRPGWRLDLCFFLGQSLLWSGLVLATLWSFRGWLHGILPAEFRAAVAAQPWWVQVVEVIVLSDLLIYWGHRLQHNVGLLWRFHAVHHSAEHLDWLAAHREHPLDTVFTVGLVNLPAFVLGFPIETIGLFVAFRGLWAVFIHSNVRLPLGFLRVLLGSPELHHWHHARARFAGNYANLSPLMDLLFGTYRRPAHEPDAFGLPRPGPTTYLGLLLRPLLPRLRAGRGSPSAAPPDSAGRGRSEDGRPDRTPSGSAPLPALATGP